MNYWKEYINFYAFIHVIRIVYIIGFRIGNHEHTRCLGHYLVKGGYKEFEELACASTEPVIAEPEIAGGISLDGSYK